MKMFSIFIIAYLLLLAFGNAARYEFIFDNEEIFESCPGIPGNNGVHDLFDLSDMIFELSEGRLEVSGNSTSVWEGVEPTDRIQGRGDLYKFQRGAWQVTPLTFAVNDFCSVQYSNSSAWYQMWTKRIAPEDRKCINVYGHVYHYMHLPVDTVFEYPVNIEGRNKLVVNLRAFDESNKERPKIICTQIVGEVIKVK